VFRRCPTEMPTRGPEGAEMKRFAQFPRWQSGDCKKKHLHQNTSSSMTQLPQGPLSTLACSGVILLVLYFLGTLIPLTRQFL
ncbi:hypothetical protein Ancab_006521, partial [Ancistrocladus abbreviatus]